MSPLEIHCLLEYYAMPDGSPDVHYRHPMAIEGLSAAGLLEKHVSGDSDKPMYQLSKRGAAYVAHLIDMPLPVPVWVLPEPYEPGPWLPNEFAQPDQDQP